MSDEATPEVAPVTPAPETEAPATADAAAVEAPTPAPETEAAPAPAVEVTQAQPSSATTEETFVEEVVEKVVDIFEAASRLVDLVEGHRVVGDAEVAAAVADVKQAVAAATPATDAPAA